ncbi:MAG: hypothetical protein L0228_13150 [Planctomycetes bacterium]|nr:hypothetical protein [Planctomycetota bacterium]
MTGLTEPPRCRVRRLRLARLMMCLGAAYALFADLAVVGILREAHAAEVADAANVATLPIEPPPSDSYRRIFVPADHVEAWPRDGEKFLPIESRDFDAWLAAANRSDGDATNSVTIGDAEYSARLQDGRLVAGRGQWKIELHGHEPAFLPLADLSLVLRNARWRNSPQRPVRLGAWGHSGNQADTVGLEVTSSGVLEFDWRVPRTSTVRSNPIHEGAEIPWRLPAAMKTRVILDLPDGKEPRIDGGVVLNLTKRGADSEGATLGRNRWELACNSSQDGILQIVDSRRGPAEATPSHLWNDDTTYRVSQRGVDIVATWHFKQMSEPLRELVIAVPRGVQLVSATAEGKDLLWHAAKESESDKVRAVLKLSDVPTRREVNVTVRAWHPLVLDQSWELPKLRPEGALWTSGNLELSIDDELEVRELSPSGCIETGVSNLTDDEKAPASWRFAAYSPTAEIKTTIARRQSDVTLRLGSSLALADPDISGRLVSEWTVARGSVHNLSGELSPGWIVESIETIPADALGEWFVDEQEGARRVEIQLTRAASAARGVTVVLSGRLPRFEFTDEISANTMRMVSWRSARVVQHLLEFETTEPYAVEPIGGLTEAEIDETGHDRATLLDSEAVADVVFDLVQATEFAGIQLTTKRGQYKADIRLEATLIARELRQEHHLVVTPTSNRVERVLVYATRSLGESVQWTESASGAVLSAKRLPPDDARLTGLPSGGELWMVPLASLTAGPVEIVATVESPWLERGELPLLSMPETAEQHGRVLIRGEMDRLIGLEPQGMTALPLPEPANDDRRTQPPIRAGYRFNPADCTVATRVPRLWVTPSEKRDVELLVAKRVELESFFSSNGDASHRTTYYLENDGGATFEVQLPDDATLRGITVNGRDRELPVAKVSAAISPIRLSIPNGSAVVSISYDTHQDSLAAGSKLRPPLLAIQTPVLSGEWKIHMPEEFSISSEYAMNWRQRLFGPLARRSDARPFQPLRASDWAILVHSLMGSRVGEGTSTDIPPGWHTYQTTFVADVPAAVYVDRVAVTSVWAVSIFLLCLVGGAWIRRGSAEWWIVSLAFSACMALLLPPMIAPLASGAVLGMLFSLIVPKARPNATQIGASTHWHRFSTVGALILAAAFGFSRLADGQPAEAAEPQQVAAEPQTIHRVLVPVDAEGQLAGTKYYVSEKFARLLLHAAAEQSFSGGQWLLKDVAYTGELRMGMEPAGVTIGEWTITCGIETIARDTIIELPLVRDEADWPANAMLDGVPHLIVWRDGGRGCAIEIAEPSEYSLILSCVPRTTVMNGRNIVSLMIPPHRGATARINYPSTLKDLTISNALPLPAGAVPGVAEFELDEADNLQLQWPVSATTASDSHGRRTTALEWLQVGADRVEFLTKYIFEGDARQSEEFIVAFDPAWELIQGEHPSFEVDAGVESADRKSVRVKLRTEDAERQEVILRWRLSNGAPLGRLMLRPIDVTSHSVTQRWRAISSTASIECSVANAAAASGTAAEFLALWGEPNAAEAPQVVLGNVQANEAWSVFAKPRQTESEISEVLHVAAESGLLRVVYQANVEPGSGCRYQFPLTVPAKLSIDEVALMSAARQLPLRWVRNADDRVNVFFSEEVASAYRVVLTGTIRTNATGRLPLPLVSAAVPNGMTTVQLYRGEDTLLEIHGRSEANETLDAPLESPPAAWTARHVAGYRLDRTAAEKLRLDVRPNQIVLSGDSLTTIEHESAGWTSRFECNFSVEQGTLDTLRLRAPSSWAGPFTLDSSAPASIAVASADTQGTTLSIRFAEAMPTGSTIDVRVDGPITFAASSIAVPEVHPEPALSGKRYVRVPTSMDGQPIAWNEIGVRTAELPAKFRSTSGTPLSTRTMEIVAAKSQITMQPRIGAPHGERVRLADTIVSADARGGQLMTTRFVVESNGLADCTLRLPDNHQLVAVRLANRPALIDRTGASNWRVALGPPQLPSILEVVFRSMEPTTEGGRRELRRPMLLAGSIVIPVEINLWSFGYPATSPRPSIGVTAEVTAAEHKILRFDRLLSIVEAATPTAVESPSPDGYNWFRPWASMLMRLRSDALDTMAQPAGRHLASQVTRPLEEQLAAVSARLDSWIEKSADSLARPEADESTLNSADEELTAQSAITRSAEDWVYYITDGDLDHLSVDFAPSVAGSVQSQYVALLAVVSLSIAAVALLRRPAVWDFLYQWPHAVGFLLGIAYWAWLEPSWLGLVIAAASVGLAFRTGWPGRAIRLDASTVLRASRPK